MRKINVFLSLLLVVNLSTYGQSIVKSEEGILDEIIESFVKQDTLVVVSTADYLFYPFSKTIKDTHYYPNIKFEIQRENGISTLCFKKVF